MEPKHRSFGELFAAPPRNGITRPKAVRGSGVKMVNMGELFAHSRILNAHMDRVSLSASESTRFLLDSGDLLFARQSLVLEGAGKCSIFLGDEEPVTFESHVTRVRLNPELADPLFYFYYLQSYHGRSAIRGIVEQGAGASGIRGSDLQGLIVQWIPVLQQRAIAHILGTLDEKIELNRRMNQTLEEIARAIFKSWFIDFDPVRAKAEGRQPAGMDAETAALFPDAFEDSELGPIPAGWRSTTLGQAIQIHDSKRVPLSSRERSERKGPYPYYGAASLMDYVDAFIFDGIHVLMGEDGSVVSSDDTPVLQYVWGKFWVNNHAHVLTGRGSVSTEQILLALKNVNIRPYVTGAVQPKLNQGNLTRIPFVLAPDSANLAFGDLVNPLFGRIRSNEEETKTLSEIRDVLLPKLLSGELRISMAERELAEAGI